MTPSFLQSLVYYILSISLLIKSTHAVSDTYLWQLFSNVTPDKHSLQVDPEVLYNQPVLNDLRGASQLLHPLLYTGLERSVVSTDRVIDQLSYTAVCGKWFKLRLNALRNT